MGGGQNSLVGRARIPLAAFCENSKIWLIELPMTDHRNKPTDPDGEERKGPDEDQGLPSGSGLVLTPCQISGPSDCCSEQQCNQECDEHHHHHPAYPCAYSARVE